MALETTQFPIPSSLKISTMTVVSNIYNPPDKIISSDEIKLDLLSRIIKIYDEDDEILSTKEGGITKVDYYTNLERNKINIASMKHIKRNPFFNQVSLIFKYYGFRSVNVKLFNNAKLQMTGIQSESESKYVSKNIINILKKAKINIYTHTSHLIKENPNPKINDYVIVFNNKTDKLSYYRWNYLNIIDEIENTLSLNDKLLNKNKDKDNQDNNSLSLNNSDNSDNTNTNNNNLFTCKLTLFNNEQDKKSFMENNGWVSDYNISKLIQILINKLDYLKEIYIKYSDKMKIISKLKEENKNFNINHEIFKLSNIITYLRNIIPYLTNIINKLNKVQECDNQILDYINKKYREDLNDLLEIETLSPVYEFNLIDNIDQYKLNNIKIELINSDFTTNFMINNTKLNHIVKNKYKAFSSYEPNDYPGVKNKFFWNANNKKNQGKCMCTPKCVERGKKSICVQITISVFQSGSVIITGAKSIQQIKDAYYYINTIFKDNYDQIHCKQQLNSKGKSQEVINNTRKIMRKKRLFYFKKEDLYPNYKEEEVNEVENVDTEC